MSKTVNRVQRPQVFRDIGISLKGVVSTDVTLICFQRVPAAAIALASPIAAPEWAHHHVIIQLLVGLPLIQQRRHGIPFVDLQFAYHILPNTP